MHKRYLSLPLSHSISPSGLECLRNVIDRESQTFAFLLNYSFYTLKAKSENSANNSPHSELHNRLLNTLHWVLKMLSQTFHQTLTHGINDLMTFWKKNNLKLIINYKMIMGGGRGRGRTGSAPQPVIS